MINIDAIINAIKVSSNNYFRLVLVIPSGDLEKSVALKQIQDVMGAILLNAGAELSQRLLEITEDQRRLALPRLLDHILSPYPLGQVIILDNIELLFDTSLESDPLNLLQKLSRNHTVIATWNGSVKNDLLIYAIPGHPEYRRYPIRDVVVMQLNS